jgi:hypothetical protein
MLLRFIVLTVVIVSCIGAAYAACQDQISSISETKIFKNYLKMSLHAYLNNPNATNTLTFKELNATIHFFLAQSDLNNIDSGFICDQSASPTLVNQTGGVNMSVVAAKFLRIENRNAVPRCSDGTEYGECSKTEPFFCYSGKLVPMCHGPDSRPEVTEDDCGCPSGSGGADYCNPDGRCGMGCTGYCSPIMEETCLGSVRTYRTVYTRCDNGICVPNGTIQNAPGQNCSQSGGYCVDGSCVACRTNADCTMAATTSCNNVTQRIYENRCYGTCHTDCSYTNPTCNNVLVRDCALEGKFCKGSGCVQCLNNTHCASFPIEDYKCLGDVIQQRYSSGSCVGNACQPGGQDSWVNVYRCIAPQLCVDGCRSCRDGTAPLHEFTVQDWGLKIVTINASDLLSASGASSNFSFTNFTLYELRNGTLFNSSWQDPSLCLRTCVSDCRIGCSWFLPSQAGTAYSFYAIVENQSGSRWNLSACGSETGQG